jgi:Asp-tRNA(Asn)/Glu-tRNA(Gln) amidotransferase A subunit family amidase
MADPELLSVRGAARAIRERRVSAVELLEETARRIEERDGAIGAFLTLDLERARAAAEEADARLARGEEVDPLHGVPFGVKDLEDTAGIRTTYGDRNKLSHVPEHDSLLVSRLRSAGAIVIGKTNTPEYGLLGETRNEIAPETANPWDTSRTTGGSSGGSAAAVAASMVPFATANDTAGSITCPAAMCGVFGIKPTLGRVPIWPDPGDSRLFLAAGPIARDSRDAALVLDVMAGPDRRDPLSVLAAGQRRDDRTVRRIAWNRDWGHFPLDPEIEEITRDAARRIEELGYPVEEAVPDVDDPFKVMQPLLAADARLLLESGDVSLHALSRDAQDEYALLGNPSGSEVAASLNSLWRFRAEVQEFFERYDLMLTPSTAVPPFKLGRAPTAIGGSSVPPRWTSFMPFQAPWNLCGNPTATLPCGQTSAGLPVGLQVTAPVGCDSMLLEICSRFEGAFQDALPSLPFDE